MNNLGYDRRRI
ncbi:hypothetical protein CP8484711_0423A, partial [Chlamydia psittaci 84-8471/1]